MKKPGHDYDPPWWKDTDKSGYAVFAVIASIFFFGPVVWQFIRGLL